VQTRRTEALAGFRLASPLHEKRRHPAKRRVSSVSGSYQGPSFSRAVREVNDSLSLATAVAAEGGVT
jgi:hypothetical protein